MKPISALVDDRESCLKILEWECSGEGEVSGDLSELVQSDEYGYFVIIYGHRNFNGWRSSLELNVFANGLIQTHLEDIDILVYPIEETKKLLSELGYCTG